MVLNLFSKTEKRTDQDHDMERQRLLCAATDHTCPNHRAVKSDGQLHELCEVHRAHEHAAHRESKPVKKQKIHHGRSSDTHVEIPSDDEYRAEIELLRDGFVLLEDNVDEEAAMQVLFAELGPSNTTATTIRPSNANGEGQVRPLPRVDRSGESSGEVGSGSFPGRLLVLADNVPGNAGKALLEFAEIDSFDSFFDEFEWRD